MKRLEPPFPVQLGKTYMVVHRTWVCTHGVSCAAFKDDLIEPAICVRVGKRRCRFFQPSERSENFADDSYFWVKNKNIICECEQTDPSELPTGL